MGSVGISGIVFHDAITVRLLYDYSGNTLLRYLLLEIRFVGDAIVFLHHHDVHAVELGVCLHHGEHLLVYGFRNEHRVTLLSCSHSHHHSLCSGCGTVIHRSVRNIHACQFSHHRLIFEDVVERAL